MALVIAAAVDPSKRPDCPGGACAELVSADSPVGHEDPAGGARDQSADPEGARDRHTDEHRAAEEPRQEQAAQEEDTGEGDQAAEGEDGQRTDEENADGDGQASEEEDADEENEDDQRTDEEIAEDLNDELDADMAGHMKGEHVSHARAMVEAAQERDMDRRAATIAVTTAIVETHLDNLSWGDRDSVGLFQQRDHYGSHEDRLDPTWAVNAFYDEMKRVYPDGSWDDEPIGDVAQGAQRSAYPDRYQHQADDAEVIVDHLW